MTKHPIDSISLNNLAIILRDAKIAARSNTAEQSAVGGVVVRVIREMRQYPGFDARRFLILADQFEEMYWLLDEVAA